MWTFRRRHQRVQMEPELHKACFFQKFKIGICFRKFEMNNVHVDNVEIYQHAKFQSKIRIISDYTQKRKIG